MISFWQTDAGRSLLWTLRLITGSVIAPIAMMRVSIALMPDGLGFWLGVIPCLLFGAANLRWSQPPLPWVGVILYSIVMLFVLFFAALFIGCYFYDLCL